jgi:aspartyl-tRNA(Asn)/glutamyl-tRNA(Gln) amidotransferase subunit C
MPDEIPREVFDKLVELAALELSPEEAKYLHGQLNNQLTSVAELAAIPLDEETPVASHGVPYTSEISPEVREDRHDPHKNPEDILAQAPESDDGYFSVPDIPHEDLS